MKVNSSRDIPFKSIYTNRAVKKGLEFAADKGALFAAISAVGFSAARPLAIMLTPKTDKENKKIATAKSITSSLIGFGMMLVLAPLLSKSIKKIDENPSKYLKAETIKSFQESSKSLENSKGYVFATQLFKLGLGAAAAIPKAMLVASGMPLVMKMFGQKKDEKSVHERNTQNNIPTFKAKPTESIAKGIGKILDQQGFQNFAEKFKSSNFPMHITALTDILTTFAFIDQIKKSKKIDEERKPALMYNSAISTGLCVAGGYVLDKMLDKPTERFIEKYRNANKGLLNTEKQIQGIRIAKPILILGAIYYVLIPLISTFLAEKADNKLKTRQ